MVLHGQRDDEAEETLLQRILPRLPNLQRPPGRCRKGGDHPTAKRSPKRHLCHHRFWKGREEARRRGKEGKDNAETAETPLAAPAEEAEGSGFCPRARTYGRIYRRASCP